MADDRHKTILEDHKKFIKEQHMFFVASSPLYGTHINVSPKGHDTHAQVIDDNTFMYLDMSGSGNETISHLRENGRVTVMYMSVTSKPLILRLFGTGKVYMRDSEEFKTKLSKHFKDVKEDMDYRSIIEINVFEVLTSCGFAVPLMNYVKDRDTLIKYIKQKGDEKIWEKEKGWNKESMDGLPGLPKFDKFVDKPKTMLRTLNYRFGPVFMVGVWVTLGYMLGIWTALVYFGGNFESHSEEL